MPMMVPRLEASRESNNLSSSSSSKLMLDSLACTRGVSSLRDTFCGAESPRASMMTTTSASTAISCVNYAEAWMFWSRQSPMGWSFKSKKDDDALAQRFTKVYAVLRNEFLFFYRADKVSVRATEIHRMPLVQIAVARACYSPMNGSFQIEDPHGESMELFLYDRLNEDAVSHWEDALEQAADMTQAKLAQLNVRVDSLPRSSLYRGSLHDFRRREDTGGFRQSLFKKVKSLTSFGKAQKEETRPRRSSLGSMYM